MSPSRFLKPKRVGRARRTLGQMWQVPTFFGGLLAFAVVAVSAPLRQDPAPREFDNDLDRLRAALVKNEKVDALAGLVESVLVRVELYPHKAGEAHFLAGMIRQRLAATVKGDEAAELRRQAAAHLEEALQRGIASRGGSFSSGARS